MKRKYSLILLIIVAAVVSISFKDSTPDNAYRSTYQTSWSKFHREQLALLETIEKANLSSPDSLRAIRRQLQKARVALKCVDLWARYLEPTAYKKLNGPLPVEWETEVFEKFEKPYKRIGAGLTLAEIYLDEEEIVKDTLLSLIQSSIEAEEVYRADSITDELNSYHHFFLCNRLYLLNLAAIYTTGFENPNTEQIVPELRDMLTAVGGIYKAFNESFPATPITAEYLNLYQQTIKFANGQPDDVEQFDHFTFIKDYINQLFKINQKLVLDYKVVSRNLIDYSLNKNSTSIFTKSLYYGQNSKGIFLRVKDSAALAEIENLGRMLFYDPILSGNNLRSCASCHKPTEHFTDTTMRTAFHYNYADHLPRNSPSLINAEFNHLIMADGKHISLQHQTKRVISNAGEMACSEQEVLKKVLSCKEYKKGFSELLKYTPQESEIAYEHIVSAITFYYSKFSKYYSPFDNAVEGNGELSTAAKHGFNLFMGKAQCATCHFVPQFNGVKPPYVGSEFEVLGVPKDKNFKEVSSDKGRYEVNPADETLNAFRTGTVRNAAYTAPYMHNGVFSTLEEVIDFYDAGGGAGHGLLVGNQTLSSDSLKLSKQEKRDLITFIQSLNEKISFEAAPKSLPISRMKMLNSRKVGGIY